MKTNINSPLIYTISMNKSQALRIGGYGVLLIFLAGGLFAALVGNTGELPINLTIILAVYVVTIILHEFVHGLFFRLFGGHPKFGIGLMYRVIPYAYATAHGEAYSLKQMLTIGLAPFILICAAALAVAIIVPSWTPYTSVAFVANFSGAVGDIWLMRQILRFRGLTKLAYVDLKNGIAVHATGEKLAGVIAKMHQVETATSSTARLSVTWMKTLLVLLGIAFLTPVILTALSFTGRILIGPSAFPLFEIDTSNSSQALKLNFLPLIVASGLFAATYTVMIKKAVFRR